MRPAIPVRSVRRARAGEKGNPCQYNIQRRDHYSLTCNEQNSTIVLPDVGAITTVNQLSQYRTEAMPWRGTQAWIMTRHRLVGLLSLESLEIQKAYSMGGTLKTVAGRAWWGIKEEWRERAPNEYSYGHLEIKIHDTSYPRIETEYTDTYSGDTKKSGHLLLLDGPDDKMRDYKKGDKHYFLVEIRPSWSKPAKHVTHHQDNHGLSFLTLTEIDNSEYTLIHNTTDADKSTKLSNEKNRVWFPTQQYRPRWLKGDHSTPGKPCTPKTKLTIPANSSALTKSR